MATQAKPHESLKHQIIKKANNVIFIAIALSVFVVIFSIFSAKALFDQASYNQKIISEKKDALSKAEQNSKNAKELEETYTAFANETINILGGNPVGTGPLDGENPKLVLDSLPSEYDYPALSSTIEKILTDNSYPVERIGGTEDPVLAAANDSEAGESSVVEIPYPITTTSTAEGVKNLLDIFERSIRFFYIDTLEISGSDQSMTVKIGMRTFYQPSKTFEVSSKVVN